VVSQFRDSSSGVPTAVIMFAHDVGIRPLAETDNNITTWTDITERGGHFTALEEPAATIRDFFRSLPR